MKNYGQALNDYSTAIELDPKYLVYYYNRGKAYSDVENTN
jgi:tetratricopeptide (TPR) repeat protein